MGIYSIGAMKMRVPVSVSISIIRISQDLDNGVRVTDRDIQDQTVARQYPRILPQSIVPHVGVE